MKKHGKTRLRNVTVFAFGDTILGGSVRTLKLLFDSMIKTE